MPIDFGGLATALLDQIHTLVPRWLPKGVERNGRWYCGDFDGADGESANVNLSTGQWIDNGAPDEDVGGDLLSLYRRVHGHHTMLDAARAVILEMGWGREKAAHPQSDSETARAQVPDETILHSAQAHVGTLARFGVDRGDESEAPAPSKSVDRWRSILPVPDHAPVPRSFVFGFKDKHSDSWVEQEAVAIWAWTVEGQRLGFTARFERINSKGETVKDVLPLTWCEDTQDPRRGQRWHWKQWASPRPLYLPAARLSTDRAVPVVVVEGEKKALAGHQLLAGEFDFVCWPGGAKAWNLAQWNWLRGRTVFLWPDADAQRAALTREERDQGVDPASKPIKPLAKQAGYAAMVGIGTLLQAELACSVWMVQVGQPGERPDGWDLADAIALEGWDAARVRDFILGAAAFVAPVVAPVVAPADVAQASAVGSGPVVASAVAANSGATKAPAREGSAGTDFTWRSHLLTTDKGVIKPVRENIEMALDGWQDRGVAGIEACVGLIAFNDFTNNIVKRRPAPWGTPEGEWQEADELLMGSWLVREHFFPSVSRQALEEAVQLVAKRNCFHPLREKVVALRGQWQPQRDAPLLDTWLARTLLKDQDLDPADPLQQYLARAGRWFLMGMVARVMPKRMAAGRVVCGPGSKFDYMLILEGPQGWGKSTLAKVLGGDYFADTGLEIGAKDSLMNIQGVWIYEWGELENLTRQEVGKIKLFISSPEDRFRATFDRRPAKYPRQVIFIGTTNESHYLTDTTGNRRFWPVRITRPPDLDWLRANLKALFAEAVHRVDAGEAFWPTREEQAALFDPQQTLRTVESSLEARLRHLLYDEEQAVPHGRANLALVNQIGLQDLLDRVGYTIDKQTDVLVKKAGALMHMFGWEIKRLSGPGRPRVYVRPADSELDRAEPTPSGSYSSGSAAGKTARQLATATQGSGDDPPF